MPRSAQNSNINTTNMNNTAIPLDETNTSVGVPTLQDMSIAAGDFGPEIPF